MEVFEISKSVGAVRRGIPDSRWHLCGTVHFYVCKGVIVRQGIKHWRGRHVGLKWIVLAHRWLNRHERRNNARIARYTDRKGWATKPKAAQLRHEYELGMARKELKAVEGAE